MIFKVVAGDGESDLITSWEVLESAINCFRSEGVSISVLRLDDGYDYDGIVFMREEKKDREKV